MVCSVIRMIQQRSKDRLDDVVAQEQVDETREIAAEVLAEMGLEPGQHEPPATREQILRMIEIGFRKLAVRQRSK